MRRALLIALFIASCSFSRSHQHRLEQRTTRQGFSQHTIELASPQLHYWKGGSGPPVLMIHGFGGDGLVTWIRQLDALADRHTLIIPDLLWFGRSSSEADPTLDQQASAMLGLLDHEGLDEVDVIAVSYGGFVALQMGTLAPDRFRRLVLVDSPGRAFAPQDVEALCQRFGVADASEIFIPTSPAAVRRLIGLAYHRPPPIPGFILRDLHRQVFSANQEAQRGLLTDLVAGRDRYVQGTPAAYEATLVLWGAHDPVFPAEIAPQVAADLDARLVVLENTAHAPNIELPAAFNAEVRAFLEPPAEAP